MISVSDLNESHLALALITDALFCSELEIGDTPAGYQLAAAIREALRTRRGWNGCTRAVAAAFAETPASATRREEWCRRLAEQALASADVQAQLSQME